MPACNGAYTYRLEPRDVESIRERSADGATIDRGGVEKWLALHTGDFQEILDFRATIGDGEFDCDFASEDGTLAYCDCFPEEE